MLETKLSIYKFTLNSEREGILHSLQLITNWPVQES